jgi:hypothetical protein
MVYKDQGFRYGHLFFLYLTTSVTSREIKNVVCCYRKIFLHLEPALELVLDYERCQRDDPQSSTKNLSASLISPEDCPLQL